MKQINSMVVGGPHSIHGNLDEIELGAIRLAEACETAGTLAGRAGLWGGMLSAATLSTSPGRELGVVTAQIAAELLWLRTSTEALEQAVKRAVAKYRDTEARIADSFNQAMVGISASRLIHDLLTGEDLATKDVSRILEHGPEAVLELIATVIPGSRLALETAVAVTDAGYQLLTGETELTGTQKLWLTLSGIVPTGTLFQMGPYRVKEVTKDRPKPVEVSPPRPEVSWMMDLMEQTFPEQAGESAVQITQVQQPDGGRVFVVTIPSTQVTGDWREDIGFEDNAWGLSGMREGMVLNSQHVITGIDTALADAGAQAGDQVVVAGYSQGGTHAANFATDARMQDKYEIPLVVSFAGPDHHKDFGRYPELNYLGFQHENDTATALSGMMPKGGAREARVLFPEDPAASVPEENSGGIFGDYHSWSNLRPLVEGETGMGDEQVRAQLEPQLQVMEELFGAPGAQVAESRTYQLTRQQTDPPRNPLLLASR